MLILALDTTSRAGSLAIVRDGELMHEMSGDPSLTHGQRLPLDFSRLCESAGVRLADVKLFAVAAGPGSFTGLRVGIAATQGLAIALGRRVVPVSTLEALAVAAPADNAHVAACVDAQRGEVFAQLWKSQEPAPESPGKPQIRRMVEVNTAVAASPEAVVELWRRDGFLDAVAFHGDGAVRYAERIRAAAGPATTVSTVATPLAGTIGRIAATEPGRAVLPHAIVPMYVRRPDAELARARREGSG